VSDEFDDQFDDEFDEDGDGSALDDVSEEDVEALEEDVDVEDLDEDERVSLDDAARALLAKPRRGHGPVARLYRGETRFDFVGRRKYWFAISTLIILLGVISLVIHGGLNLGIEFKGGTEWTIAAPGVTQTEAVDAMKGTGLVNPTVELLGSGSKQTLNVQSDLNKLFQANQQQISRNVQRAMLTLTAAHAPKGSHVAGPTTTTSAAPSTTTTAKAGAAATASTTTTTSSTTTTTVPADKISITTVGPTWGQGITNDAIKAMIIFFIVVAIYISIRFEPKMALAAFIAMIHDVLVAVGIYSIFNFQVTPDTVVAILTILGYSLYDTVVVFDRVRDNTKGIGSSGRLTYPQLINLSMNQTLARSINTSAVAILPVLAVLLIGAQFLGASTLQAYGLALFVGLLSGAYSSIFIASPVLSMMKEREDRWIQIEKRLRQRNELDKSFSALDAATMSTQMSISAGGQAVRTGGGGSAAPQPAQQSGATKRSGPIRPGSAQTGGSGGGGTAVMDRPGAAGEPAGQAPRPRKSKGKRRR
jgi:preprotein translocase subunit SecF